MTRATVSESPFLPGWVWLIPLALIVFFYEALQPVSNPTERIVWYSVLIIAGATALTRVCRIQKQFDLFEPLHLTFALFVIFYPVRALFAVWLDDNWFDPSQAAIWKALSASVLGFVSFAIGYKIGPRKSAVPRRIWLDRSWNLERAQVVSLAFLLLGITAFVAMRFLGGSLLYFILVDPDIKGPQAMTPWFYYLFWICLLIQVGALVQLGAWFSSGRRAFWTAIYCILALLSGCLMGRLFCVFCVTTLTLTWHYMRSRIRIVQVVMLLFLVLAYLGVAGLYREWISPGYDLEETGDLVELAGQQDQLILRYVVANLQELSNLSEVISMTPSELPYQFGMTFTPVILKPIPRVLMPSKPLGASGLFARQTDLGGYDSGFTTAIGAWGEWYLNFSWLGLTLGFLLTGALSSAAYRAMRATTEFGRVMLYASFVVLLLTWLRSDFNAATTVGLYYFIPAIVVLMYVTNDSRGSKTQSGVRGDSGPFLEETAK